MNNSGMMKQLLQMRKQLKKTQNELEKEIITGSSKDACVQIMLTGAQKFHRVILDEDKVKPLNNSQLEKHIGDALQDALSKSRSLMAEKLGPLGGGMTGMKF